MKTIIIIGMHRSGTSFTASLLQKSGLNVGQELMGSATGNAKGHYENLDFYTFHMRMLERLRLHPDGWDEVEIESIEKSYEEEAKAIIEKNQAELWGWKDPRTTLFLKVWAKLLPEAYFLFVYRSPAEVIDSLYRRGTDQWLVNDPEKAANIWLHYNKLVLNYYQEFKDRSLLIHINSFIQAYPECLEQINKKFQVALTPCAQDLFDKALFNENADALPFKTQVLFDTRPDLQQLYKELIQASWHPSRKAYEQEFVPNQINKEDFTRQFFMMWKDACAMETQRKAYSRNHTVKNNYLRVAWQKIKQLF